jgi:hypothetical protein
MRQICKQTHHHKVKTETFEPDKRVKHLCIIQPSTLAKSFADAPLEPLVRSLLAFSFHPTFSLETSTSPRQREREREREKRERRERGRERERERKVRATREEEEGEEEEAVSGIITSKRGEGGKGRQATPLDGLLLITSYPTKQT